MPAVGAGGLDRTDLQEVRRLGAVHLRGWGAMAGWGERQLSAHIEREGKVRSELQGPGAGNTPRVQACSGARVERRAAIQARPQGWGSTASRGCWYAKHAAGTHSTQQQRPAAFLHGREPHASHTHHVVGQAAAQQGVGRAVQIGPAIEDFLR